MVRIPSLRNVADLLLLSVRLFVWKFQIYKQFREELLIWYNTVRPHQSLDWDTMETPDKAFIRKLKGKQKENCQKTETENREGSA